MNKERHKQRIIQWVTGGKYAVAVEVEVIYPRNDPSEPCLTPQTVRWLEELADRAEAGGHGSKPGNTVQCEITFSDRSQQLTE